MFGVHSGGGQLGSKLDGALYLKSYRALAIFLALADDALAAAPAAQSSGAASAGGAPTSSR